MLSYTEEANKIVEKMKQKKGNCFSQIVLQMARWFLMIAPLIASGAILMIIYQTMTILKLSSNYDENLIFSGITLGMTCLALIIPMTEFCLIAAKKSEFLIVHKIIGDQDIERIICEIDLAAKKQKIIIKDVDIIVNRNRCYLKIKYC